MGLLATAISPTTIYDSFPKFSFLPSQSPPTAIYPFSFNFPALTPSTPNTTSRHLLHIGCYGVNRLSHALFFGARRRIMGNQSPVLPPFLHIVSWRFKSTDLVPQSDFLREVRCVGGWQFKGEFAILR